MFLAVFADIGCAQPLRQIEIYLMRAALPVPADCIAQYKFKFRSVECAFAGVVRIVQARLFERCNKRRFSLVPDAVFAYADFGSIGKFDDDVVEA